MKATEEFPLAATLERVAELMNADDVDTAARLSGEALAMYDNDLRLAFHTADRAGAAIDMVRMATAHIFSLRALRMPRDAFQCALMVLVNADVAEITANTDAHFALLPLSVHTALALMEAVDTIQPTAEVQLHASMALALIGRLMERFGAATATDGSATLLPQLLAAAPDITVDGIPATDASIKALLAELLALAHSIL
ncbi:MAG: hypothetical protein ACI4AM_06220 [Muribaculaceae bacterium]